MDEDMTPEQLEIWNWKYEQFKETSTFMTGLITDHMNILIPFHKVNNRPCDVQLVEINSKKYYCYRYKNETLFIPCDFHTPFDDVVSISGNEFGMTCNVFSKTGDNFEQIIYQLNMWPDEECIHFSKLLIQCPIDEVTFQRAIKEAGSEELFFAGRRFNEFFNHNPNTVRKSIEVVKSQEEAKVYMENSTNMRSSLDKFLSGQRVYTPVDKDLSFFEIVESYDIHAIK